MNSGPSDTRLIDDARAGNRNALEALLARHESGVYRYALRMCGNADEAQDVLQETLLAAFKGLGHFRGEAGLSTWLFQIARSFCSKARRRRVGEPASHQPLDGPEVRAVADESDPLRHAQGHELEELVRAAFGALPGHYREVLHLKDVEGLSAEEVAEVIGEQVPAAKSRLYRARLELRRHLEAVLDEEPGTSAECAELEQAVSAASDGDIDRGACERMEAHMEQCSRCRHACDSLKRSIAMCSRTEGDDVPAPVRAAIRRAIGPALIES